MAGSTAAKRPVRVVQSIKPEVCQSQPCLGEVRMFRHSLLQDVVRSAEAGR